MRENWQVELSSKSLKKTRKYGILGRIMPCSDRLICMEAGAETGVITDYLRREKGGRWIAGVLAERWYGVSQELLKEDVYEINPSRIGFPDSTFDIVLASRPEHIFDDIRFFAEVHRVLKLSGRIFILTPHNEPELFLNRLKEKIGLTLEQYDHYRPGYGTSEMEDKLRKAGFVVERSGSYCKFFTELIELLLNAGYSFMGKRKEKSLSYRPETKEEIGKNKLGYMVYSWIYPFLRIISLLDYLLPFTKGYVLYMQAKKK